MVTSTVHIVQLVFLHRNNSFTALTRNIFYHYHCCQ